MKGRPPVAGKAAMPQDRIVVSRLGLGPSLRAWRLARRIKQGHAAELLGVSQATVSRWESGRQPPAEAEAMALARLLAARPTSAADRELARLVSQSRRPLHLVCDLTHTLLAASPARRRDMAADPETLMGHSLWRHASAEIVALEERLEALGWYEPAAVPIEAWTGANRSAALAIRPGRFRITRFQLSCGGFARLVETLGS